MGDVIPIEDGAYWKWAKDEDAVMELQEQLEEEERKSPALKKMAENIDRTIHRSNFHARIDARRAAEGKPPLRRWRGG